MAMLVSIIDPVAAPVEAETVEELRLITLRAPAEERLPPGLVDKAPELLEEDDVREEREAVIGVLIFKPLSYFIMRQILSQIDYKGNAAPLNQQLCEQFANLFSRVWYKPLIYGSIHLEEHAFLSHSLRNNRKIRFADLKKSSSQLHSPAFLLCEL